MNSREVGPDQVAIDERLERAGAVDAGQRVALEDQRLLARAGRHQQHLRPDDDVAALAQDADAPVREDRERGAVEPDPHVLERAHVAFEPRRDVDAARARIAGVDRPEELVRLEHELSAEAVLVVDDQRRGRPRGPVRWRRSGPAGPPPMIRHSVSIVGMSRSMPASPATSGSAGLPSSGATRMPGADRHHARLHGAARRRPPCTGRTGRLRRRCPGARRPWGGGRTRGCRWRRAPTKSSRPRRPSRASFQ